MWRLAELVCDESRDQFIAKHADKLQGTLSCFDNLAMKRALGGILSALTTVEAAVRPQREPAALVPPPPMGADGLRKL